MNEVTEDKLNEVYKVFFSCGLSEISRMFNIPMHLMANVHYYCMHRRLQERQFLSDFSTHRYYDTEQDIFNALELKYESSDLKGWELEQYNKR